MGGKSQGMQGGSAANPRDASGAGSQAGLNQMNQNNFGLSQQQQQYGQPNQNYGGRTGGNMDWNDLRNRYSGYRPEYGGGDTGNNYNPYAGRPRPTLGGGRNRNVGSPRDQMIAGGPTPEWSNASTTGYSDGSTTPNAPLVGGLGSNVVADLTQPQGPTMGAPAGGAPPGYSYNGPYLQSIGWEPPSYADSPESYTQNPVGGTLGDKFAGSTPLSMRDQLGAAWDGSTFNPADDSGMTTGGRGGFFPDADGVYQPGSLYSPTSLLWTGGQQPPPQPMPTSPYGRPMPPSTAPQPMPTTGGQLPSLGPAYTPSSQDTRWSDMADRYR